MIQKYPSPAGTLNYNPTQQFQNKINNIVASLIFISTKEDAPKHFTSKDLDIARRFEKVYKDFTQDKEFNEKFQFIIYE